MKNKIIIVLFILVGVLSWNNTNFDQHVANEWEIFNNVLFILNLICGFFYLTIEIEDK